MCRYLGITRSSYYRWLKHPKSDNEIRNEQIADIIREIHRLHPDMGYRRIRDECNKEKGNPPAPVGFPFFIILPVQISRELH